MQLFNSRFDAGASLAAEIKQDLASYSVWFVSSPEDLSVAQGIARNRLIANKNTLNSDDLQESFAHFYSIDNDLPGSGHSGQADFLRSLIVVKDGVGSVDSLSRDITRLRLAGYDSILLATPMIVESLVPAIDNMVEHTIALQTVPLMIDTGFWYVNDKECADQWGDTLPDDSAKLMSDSTIGNRPIRGARRHLHLV